MLLGRGTECARLDASLAAARHGRSDALVLVGEPGVGKTALLGYAADHARDLRVLRAAGVESEMELAYAALHQLCMPLLDGLDRLPPPQAEAVATIFGLRAGPPPGTFLVGLGVLNLLAEAARERPVLGVVDDAQWLDAASAQVLAFVARRLTAESVFLLLASRRSLDSLAGLTELTVAGLPDGEARTLLGSVVRWPLDDGVRSAILAEARGNPLALLELPLASPGSLAGGFGLLDTPPLAGRIEDSFLRRAAELPEESRTLLLVAAADPVGDPVLMWRAAGLLGLSREAGAAAEAAGLLTVGARVAFRHPLVRSAVYRSAGLADRRRVHRALGEATSPRADPDRRAWHLAQAAGGEDETIAADLEASAGRARARGGLAAAAAFRERAAALTGDPELRAGRELAAARDKYHAGALDDARSLLDRVEAGPADTLRAAHVRQLRGHLAFATGRSAAAPGLLLDAARQLAALDPALSRETYLDAVTYALLAGRFADGVTPADVAAAARTAPPAADRPQDLLLDGFGVLFTEGHAAGTPVVRRALDAFRRDELPPDEAIRWLGIACHGAYEVWDDRHWEALADLGLRHTRATGALVMLPVALNQRINAHLHAGEFTAASALLEESRAVADATGIARPAYDAAAVAAWRGQEAEARALLRAAGQSVTRRGEGIGLTLVQHATAVLLNGLGQFPEALRAAELATANPGESAFASWALAELVEAAVRCGEHDRAAAALDRLARTTAPSGTDWGLGVHARSRALISGDEELYREAIERLGRSRGVVALARAHQVYGEWLRRHDRTAEGRQQLRTAHEMFVTIGAEAFAARARQELAATGETITSRVRGETAELTAQEYQIARRARDGRSNAEIGAELFLSARTIEWHLRKVFGKLGITSRRELGAALPGVGGHRGGTGTGV
ncbi:LuxR family transcriptional regulator [Actinoplanes missouriensis]|uniref:LuxR family transcriptional regulator n=1 Tax=Actinoplanes missouriensis TaxID=1866 RepID=UPI0033C59CFC